MKHFIFLFLFSFLLILEGYGQAKPQRDISKDRNSVVAKSNRVTPQQKQTTVTKSVQPKRINASYKKNRNKKKIYRKPQSETFLYVDNTTGTTKYLGYMSGMQTFSVNTNAKDWQVQLLPSWCRVNIWSESFTLYYDANPTHGVREDWFKVIANGQEVKVYLSQAAAPYNVSGRVLSASLIHNEKKYSWTDNEYLTIKASVNLTGANNTTCVICASFQDQNGLWIKANSGYSAYSDNDNNVLVHAEIRPTTDSPTTYNIELTLPNNAMYLTKKENKLSCILAIFCNETSELIESTICSINFKATNKRGKVKTSN